MNLTAEHCSSRADFYDTVAASESAPREYRLLFARKANAFRILARLAAERESAPVPASAPRAVSFGL
jgi:hypothetical protein